MKKYHCKSFIISLTLLLASFFNPSSSLAQIPTIVGDPVTKDTLEGVNPINIFGSNEAKNQLLPSGNFSVAGLLNRTLVYIFPLAGLVLFLMLVWGGFEMLTGAASKKNLDAGKQRITTALIGFLLLFASYWIVQIVEYVTGVNILG